MKKRDIIITPLIIVIVLLSAQVLHEVIHVGVGYLLTGRIVNCGGGIPFGLNGSVPYACVPGNGSVAINASVTPAITALVASVVVFYTDEELDDGWNAGLTFGAALVVITQMLYAYGLLPAHTFRAGDAFRAVEAFGPYGMVPAGLTTAVGTIVLYRLYQNVRHCGLILNR